MPTAAALLAASQTPYRALAALVALGVVFFVACVIALLRAHRR